MLIMTHKVERVEFDFKMSKKESVVWKRNQSKFIYKLDRINNLDVTLAQQDGIWHFESVFSKYNYWGNLVADNWFKMCAIYHLVASKWHLNWNK